MESSSRSIKHALKAFHISVIPFENLLNGLPLTFVLLWQEPWIGKDFEEQKDSVLFLEVCDDAVE